MVIIMKKRFFSLILTLIIISSLNVGASAKSRDEWLIKQQDDGAVYLENSLTNETIIDAFRFDNNGKQIKVDLIKYANELNNLPVITSIDNSIGNEKSLRGPSTAVSNSYKETNKYKGIGSGKKVTPDIIGPATVSYGESLTVSQGFGGDLSITASIQKAITAGASFSWTTSLSSCSQFSTAYPVPSGKKGYVEFRPYYNVSEGTLTQKRYSQSGIVIGTTKYDVWGQCPIKLSTGFSDGVYALKTYK